MKSGSNNHQKKLKQIKGFFFSFLNTQLIITLWNLLSQDITRAKSLGRMQRKDQTLAVIVMRAFTAFTFGKTETEIKVQMFMLQVMNQPSVAGGWEDTLPHGQVLHRLLPKDFSRGWRGPTGCNCSCSSVFPRTSVLHL